MFVDDGFGAAFALQTGCPNGFANTLRAYVQFMALPIDTLAIGVVPDGQFQSRSIRGAAPKLTCKMWEYVKYLNIFVYCKFLKLLGHVMVLLVLGIVAFIWYAVVPATYGPMIMSQPPAAAAGSAVLVILFSGLAAARELEMMQYSDYYVDRRDPCRPRYCKRCKAWKPERAHHCSVSGHCVLKMASNQ
eukprot:gene8159-8352_t